MIYISINTKFKAIPNKLNCLLVKKFHIFNFLLNFLLTINQTDRLSMFFSFIIDQHSHGAGADNWREVLTDNWREVLSDNWREVLTDNWREVLTDNWREVLTDN